MAKPKEYNPLEAAKNLKIGDFYYKKKNWDGAIDRYLEALAYQPDLAKARKALQQACTRSIREQQEFLQKNPHAPDATERRNKIARLEKALAGLKTPNP